MVAGAQHICSFGIPTARQLNRMFSTNRRAEASYTKKGVALTRAEAPSNIRRNGMPSKALLSVSKSTRMAVGSDKTSRYQLSLSSFCLICPELHEHQQLVRACWRRSVLHTLVEN